jgi:hypothetical protein
VTMVPEGKVRVVVRSRRVPTDTVDFHAPIYSGSTSGILMGSRRKRIVLYDYVLNEDHKRAIEEASNISRRLGLELEVVDASKQGILGRVLTSLGLKTSRGLTLLVAPVQSGYEGPIPRTLSSTH